MDEGRASARVLALSLVGLAFFLSWQALALRSYLRIESRPPSQVVAASLQAALDGRDPAAPGYGFLLEAASAGRDPIAAGLWLNWFYLALLSVAVFGIAWHFRPDETALLAVVILAGSPALQELLHTQTAGLALMACVAAGYWALLGSDEFRQWPASLAFGAVFAAGMLHGWSFASYFLPGFYVGAKALSRPNSRLKVLAAAAVALAGFLPWCAAALPILLARLWQAPAVYASALRLGGAVLGSLVAMANGLGAPLSAFALVGLCIPQYRRNWHRGWILAAWFVSSFILWALLANSQMRDIAPCLPALVVAGLGAWPRGLIWALALVQLFTMANFTSGAIAPIPVALPIGRLALFPSQPPVRQDWHIAEILRQVQARRDPQRPFSNLTVAADDERFNQDDFELTARRLGISGVRIRRSDERLCEFSRFVLLKSGSAQPVKSIMDPKSWFSGAYEEVQRWPLPDKSSAVLYQQRRFTAPPARAGRYQYQFYSSGPVETVDLVFEFGGWDAQRGVFGWGKVSAAEVRVGGLRLAGLQVEMEDLLFQPIFDYGSNTWGDVRFLKLGRLRIKSLRVDRESVRTFLEAWIPGLQVSELDLDKTVKLRGRMGGIQFGAEAAVSLEAAPPALRIELLNAQLGQSRLPDFLLASLRTFSRSLAPTAETPFAIEVPGLTLSDGRLSVP
jgi:hypothetical protein